VDPVLLPPARLLCSSSRTTLETTPGLNRPRRQELRAALDVIAGLNRRWLQDRCDCARGRRSRRVAACRAPLRSPWGYPFSYIRYLSSALEATAGQLLRVIEERERAAQFSELFARDPFPRRRLGEKKSDKLPTTAGLMRVVAPSLHSWPWLAGGVTASGHLGG
jgi:hypothetical protein